jgi:hypothetical protein
MMIATADRPTAGELDQLEELAKANPLSRADLAAKLQRIEQGLRDHGRELDRSNGLLDETDKADRMSLAREDDRLRAEGSTLVDELAALRTAATSGTSDDDFRRQIGALVTALRGHRNAESSLVLESADTEVGAGD